MKSKLVIITGAVVIAALASTATVAAARYVELPWTNNIYLVSDHEQGGQPTVSVFDDAGNKCYVVRGYGGTVAIDCVENR
ncbi:hypothetical protein [Rhodococcus ruber]|uniref:hypothetical protein n=1 Tax=Rhodococcus ruber TaxID=1830 RepID=UPI001F48BA2B|nr:hypothetical protein [Rhodococcus ruber]MCF8783216.1 hypothetical protein [Rhodococcus ruber]